MDLTVADGVTRLRGTNGTGKSTLIETVSGYLRPWAGWVGVRGIAAHDPAARARRRVCRSRDALIASLTVREHLVVAGRAAGASPSAAVDRAERYGMAQWLDAPVETLSTGNRRKVWLQSCTTGAFDVAVLDEPFDGLDDHGVATLIAEIETWRAGGAVLVVCHTVPPGFTADHEVTLQPAGSPR